MQDRRSRERRNTARSRILKVAKVILGTSSVIDCVVRNVTNTGARIHIPNTVDLPEALSPRYQAIYERRLFISKLPSRMAVDN